MVSLAKKFIIALVFLIGFLAIVIKYGLFNGIITSIIICLFMPILWRFSVWNFEQRVNILNSGKPNPRFDNSKPVIVGLWILLSLMFIATLTIEIMYVIFKWHNLS